jgi:hypothetical protein
MAGVELLRERRQDMCDKFAGKCLSSERFKQWFPLREGRKGRNGGPYREFYARCERFRNTPVMAMRRRLNQLARENNRA